MYGQKYSWQYIVNSILPNLKDSVRRLKRHREMVITTSDSIQLDSDEWRDEMQRIECERFTAYHNQY